MCVFKNHWSAEKTCYKMIFWPEHAEDISCGYRPMLNQIFEFVSDLFVKKILKRLWPLAIVFVCISSCSLQW